MRIRLLTVKDAFAIPGRFVVLDPPLLDESLRSLADRTIEVEVIHPDGSRVQSTVRVLWEHLRPGRLNLVCTTDALTKDDVPPGTEIWYEPER